MKFLVCEVPADLETPVTAFAKLKGRFLLESVEQGEKVGRYSFIGLGSRLFRSEPGEPDPLPRLKRVLLEFGFEKPDDPLPDLVGGAVGYIAYDYIRDLEKLPDRRKDPLRLPICHFFITDTVVVFDHLSRKMMIVALEADAIDRILAALQQPVPRALTHPAAVAAAPQWESNMTREQFVEAIRKIKEYIAAGDIFQCVLSQRLSADVPVDPFQVYRALRLTNPSPYMFFLDYGDYQIVGSSPEVHVRLNRGQALARPIAGTRRRGATPEEDRALEQELLANEKERAEHLMLVDLARNDLGRCCKPGSVRVRDFYVVERYSHVMHIVSETVGALSDDQDQFDLLAKTFPAGTVTGAPKIRAMEIIEELEPTRRAFYAGTIGYFSLTGDMNMAITIRTMLIQGTTIHLQAGAGVVHDSDSQFEYQETLQKMKGLQVAVELAARGLRS